MKLSIYPGQPKTLQFRNPDSTPYAIPAGSAIASKLINTAEQLVADLAAQITTAATGVAQITLPDTQVVRDHRFRPTYFDVQLIVPTKTLYLPMTEVDIEYSPTVLAGAIALPYPTPSPAPTTTPSPSPAATPTSDRLYPMAIDFKTASNKIVELTITENSTTGDFEIQLAQVV